MSHLHRPGTAGLLSLSLLMGLGSCSDPTEPLVPTTIDLDVGSLSLEVGQSASIRARLLDQFGNVLASAPQGFSITWSGANSSIAAVSGGEVTGISPGETTVTARAGTLTPVEVDVGVVSRPLMGSLSFDYGGERSGTYAVSSQFRVTKAFSLEAPDAPEWVLSYFDAGSGIQEILAGRRRTDELMDVFYLEFRPGGPITSPGTYEIHDGFVLFGFSPSQQFAEASFRAVVGETVEFTSVSAGRLAGEFQITMTTPFGRMLEVSEGRFDVPVARDGDLGFASAQASFETLNSATHILFPGPNQP